MNDLFPAGLVPVPERFIWHWTAGRHTASAYELSRYGICVEHHENSDLPGDALARVVAGVPLARNMRPLAGVAPAHQDPIDGYAAHTGGLNGMSGSIALCGMFNAVDLRPTGDVVPGPFPITLQQVRAMLGLSASAALVYRMEVTDRTFLTHYEVHKIYGVGRQDKWNVTWLPGMKLEKDDVGPFLREQLRRWLAGSPIDDRLYAPPVGDSPHDALQGDDR
jgi:hypothetical protein